MNPYKKMISILTTDELLDFVFSRASKVEIKNEKRLKAIIKARKKESYRIRTVEEELTNKLEQYIKSYPNFDLMDPFYLELTDIVIDGGLDKIRKVLASLSGGIPVINKISSIALNNIRYSSNAKEIAKIRMGFYGRISSIIKQYSDRFLDLIAFRQILRKLPTVDPRLPTIVVAGYPNVGKSSLVKIISTAKPEISYYPFTTKKIIVGRFNYEQINIQIIDSPGLLDRSLDKRNKIEIQSILALNYLAKIIIFMIDPSEFCGYPIKRQISLLKNIMNIFSDIPFILIQNKIDLKKTPFDFENELNKKFKVFRTDLKNKVGIQDIIDYIINNYEELITSS